MLSLQDVIAATVRIIAEPIPAKRDDLAEAEVQDLEKARSIAELRDFTNEVENRSKYTSRLFWLMVGWIVVVLGILIASGVEVPPIMPDDVKLTAFGRWVGSFRLSDPVLIALIGGTTANVIGLFLVVANYLFGPRRKHSNGPV